MTTRAARPRSAVSAAAGVFGVFALAACGSSTPSSAGAKPSASANARTVEITITNDGCKPDVTDYTSGPLTFHIKNQDAAGVTEFELLSAGRILGEKENLAPGFAGTFALQLSAGEYTVYCPGATNEKSTIKVTGKDVSAAPTTTSGLLAAGTKSYATYVNTQMALMVTNTEPLVVAIKAGNLAVAQKAYGNARGYYERIEPVAESFTTGQLDLDAAIDARADDVPANQLTGYHRIEKGLFTDKSTAGLEPVADRLVADIKKLQGLVKGLTYQPAELANGAVSLLDEAAKTKVTGEEERYSHVDLVDLQGNVEGSEQAFAALKPGLDKVDPTLSATISSRFAAMDKLLGKYRDAAQPGGFVVFTKLTSAETRAIAQGLQAISEPLSKVAGKVVSS